MFNTAWFSCFNQLTELYSPVMYVCCTNVPVGTSDVTGSKKKTKKIQIILLYDRSEEFWGKSECYDDTLPDNS